MVDKAKEALAFYEGEMRTVIQFSASWACEGLAVDLLRELAHRLWEIYTTEENVRQ